MREKIRVAREAARLLYYNLARDYKQAKERACKELGTTVFPNNFEVAMELDRLADEIEGKVRRDLNVHFRKEALKLMNHLKDFNPRLVGGVWRGTARKGSDIDISVYSDDIELVLSVIEKRYGIIKAEFTSRVVGGKTERYFHVHIPLSSEYEAEIVVRNPQEFNYRNECEIYGDYVTGLTIGQLQKVLEEDPTKKFIPKKRK